MFTGIRQLHERNQDFFQGGRKFSGERREARIFPHKLTFMSFKTIFTHRARMYKIQ
jgi:hypothetical protein